MSAFREQLLALVAPEIYLPATANFTDASGNGFNGSAQGGVTAGSGASSPPIIGESGSTDFDGVNDYLTTAYGPTAGAEPEHLHFGAWLKRAALTENAIWGTSENTWLQTYGERDLRFTPNWSTNTFTLTNALPAGGGVGEWLLLGLNVLHTGAGEMTVEVYVNGVLTASAGPTSAYYRHGPAGRWQLAKPGTALTPWDGEMAHVFAGRSEPSAETWAALYAAAVTESPEATTGEADDLTSNSATLNGTVDAGGGATTYYFEYGLTEAYGTKIPAGEDGEAGEGTEPAAVDEAISGLKANTTYHFRLLAVNAAGEDVGADQTFTTEPEAPKPTGLSTGMRLDVELCDLEQNVLARLDNRRSGMNVEIGLNRARTASVPLALEDAARSLVAAQKTILRVTLRGPEDFSRTLFVGRVLSPEHEGSEDGEQVTITAIDPLAQLESLLIRKAAEGFIGPEWQALAYPGVDQSAIMWELIDSVSGHGIIEGTLAAASINRTRTYAPGGEIANALLQMSAVDGGPDFDLEPVIASDGTLCEFNTYYPKQGSDKTADVIFTYRKAPYTAKGFTYAPGGDQLVNRVVAIGAGVQIGEEEEGGGGYLPDTFFPAYLAEHTASIEKYGPFERRLQLEDVTEKATLEAAAKAVVAAGAEPIPFFDFTAAPEKIGDGEGDGVPPVFGIDYWVGDTVACHAYLDGAGADPLELTGRITDATVTELPSGQLSVKVSCSPEVSSSGVTGESITLVVPEVIEE